ncbi:MAG: cation:proton antiporter [Candidatus Aminicenantes bacterium]|nr:MAG: cation:proton antiporter [Candidatus Aminicenantes bacterium]
MSNLEALLLLCICTGAFLMPFLFRRLSLPSAVGEILFGLFIGLFFKEAFHKTTIIKFLGELGFILLMYLVGLEINFEKIKTTPKKEIYLYSSMIALVVILSFLLMTYFHQVPIYALIYLTTAVGLLFPVLHETRILEKDIGQKLLIIGSIGEVVSLMALTVFTLYYRFGFSRASAIHLGQLAAFLLGAFIIYRLFRLLVWWFPVLVRPFLKSSDPMQSSIRANFVNMFIFVGLAALLDMELIVGAFIGGMAFALIFKKREEIQRKIGGIAYGFLIPVFFIEVGLQFDMKDFLHLHVLLTAVIISLVIFFVRALASLVLFLSPLTLIEITLVPVSISFPLTLLAAIATFGLEHQIITGTQAASILLAAILTAVIYPFIMKKIIKALQKKDISP